MQSLLIGCGDTGNRTLEALIRLSPRLTPLCIDTDQNDLQHLSLPTEGEYDPLLHVEADPYPPTPERGLNAANAYKWHIAAKIEEALEHAGQIDAFTLITGVGGTTGAGMSPSIAHLLKDSYFEDQYPLLIVCILPPKGDPRADYNALHALQTLTKEVNYDGLILSSNTPEKTAGALSPLYHSQATARRDLIPLFQMTQSLSTIGHAQTPHDPNTRLASTVRTQVTRALNTLLTPAQIDQNTHGLIIIRTPPTDDPAVLEPARNWVNTNTEGIFHLVHQQTGEEEVGATLLATSLSRIPRLKEITRNAERVHQSLNATHDLVKPVYASANPSLLTCHPHPPKIQHTNKSTKPSLV